MHLTLFNFNLSRARPDARFSLSSVLSREMLGTIYRDHASHDLAALGLWLALRTASS